MKRTLTNIALATSMTLAACGSDPGVPPTLNVDIFGWSASEGFSGTLPALDDAQTVRVKVTRPLNREVVESTTSAIAARTISIPDLPFGENLRLDFELLDSQATLIGAGATPMFEFEPERQLLSFRVQVTQVNAFSPVGNVVVDRNTNERKFAWTQFDYRGKEGVTWLGRAGHASAATSDGRILIVGGGDPVPGTAPGSLPEFRSLYADVQLFDPQTGYFSDLAFDDASGALLSDGRDRLFEPVVFHTVTPLGDDRFLIAGGFTTRSDVLRPVNTIQIIDLNATAGSRVTRLVDANGSSLVLQKARGWHTATYRRADDHVVITGGIGPQGEDDVLATYELVNLVDQTVAESSDLVAARAQHAAVLMNDNRTIWLIGGRSASAALSTTEAVRLDDTGSTESTAEATMRRARFGLAAVNITPGTGDLVLVAGGFTDLEGAVDDSFEVSRLGRDSFDTGGTWKLSEGRGGAALIELPQSNDIVLIGGLDAEGDPIAHADILTLDDLAKQPPFTVESSDNAATPRFGASVDLLTNGRILIVGGVGDVNNARAGLDTADMFNPRDPVGGDSSVVVISE